MSKSIQIKTEVGKLRCELHTDPDYPGLTLYVGKQQIAVVEVPRGHDGVTVMVWQMAGESPTNKIEVDVEPQHLYCAKCRDHITERQLRYAATAGDGAVFHGKCWENG